jgi:hypothetical protein
MRVEAGVIVISLVVLLITFLLFGRNVGNSFREEFLYWMKSTTALAPILFAWIVYNEPGAFGLIGGLVSVGLAAAFTLGRSYLVAML